MPLDKLPNKTYSALGLSLIDRAFKEHHATRCSAEELKKIKKHFAEGGDIHCIYCAERVATRWDHFFPVSKGGDTVPGNLVPACASCDDSKQEKTIDEWAEGRGKFKPTAEGLDPIRKRIKKYRELFPYNEIEFIDKYSYDVKEKYKRLQKSLSQVRAVLLSDGVITK